MTLCSMAYANSDHPAQAICSTNTRSTAERKHSSSSHPEHVVIAVRTGNAPDIDQLQAILPEKVALLRRCCSTISTACCASDHQTADAVCKKIRLSLRICSTERLRLCCMSCYGDYARWTRLGEANCARASSCLPLPQIHA